MKVVVVGGQGFLGRATVRELISRGDAVTVFDPRASQAHCDKVFGVGAVHAHAGSALDPQALAHGFRGADEVYNFAGVLGTSELDEDVAAAVEGNIMTAVNVFDAARDAAVGAVFYPSKPNVWLNAYTITKAAAERLAELYAANGLRIHVLRYFNAYGPGQATGPVRKIIPSFAREAIAGRALTVFGDGTQTVDMIFAADAGRITVDVVRTESRHDPVDCGRGVALTVNQVADAVNAHFGNRAGVRHVTMRRGETPGTKLVADIEPLRRLVPTVSFADWPASLAATLESYREPAA